MVQQAADGDVVSELLLRFESDPTFTCVVTFDASLGVAKQRKRDAPDDRFRAPCKASLRIARGREQATNQ